MNCSVVNVTSRIFSTADIATRLIFFSVSFVLGIVGNILLVATVCNRSALHRVTYYLVSALAVEDLVTLIVYGIFLPQAVVLGDWFLGDFSCSVYISLISSCDFCEVFLIVVISVDRYIACCRPLRYPYLVTQSRCAVAICSCWILALAITLCLISECKIHGYDEYLKNCLIQSSYAPRTRSCLVAAFVLIILPCTTTVAVCQWKILKLARRVNRITPPNVTSGTNENTSGNRRNKAATTVCLVAGTFFMCWFPFLTVNASGAVVDWKESAFLRETQYILTRITFQIFLVSKFANPIIYGIYNQEFRSECRQLFSRFI